jgi:hypothetical protein
MRLIHILLMFAMPLCLTAATIPTTYFSCEVTDTSTDNQFSWRMIRGEARYFQVTYFENDVAANLSDASSTNNVTLWLKASDSTNTYAITGGIISSPSSGVVRVLWPSSNVPPAAIYSAEFAVPDSPDVNLAARGKITVVDGTASGTTTAMPAYMAGNTNHAELINLDYASAGHTGFQPAGSYLTAESDPVFLAFTNSSNVAIGSNTVATGGGVVIGDNAIGQSGVAVGSHANGENQGVAVGVNATGSLYGVAIGINADGSTHSVAIGENAYAYGVDPAHGNIAIGMNAFAQDGTYTMLDTTEIGAGQATNNGWFHYRGKAVIDGNGNIPASIITDLPSGGGADEASTNYFRNAVNLTNLPAAGILLADGSVAWTADHNAGGFPLTNCSNISGDGSISITQSNSSGSYFSLPSDGSIEIRSYYNGLAYIGQRPTVNGTNILLQGEAAAQTDQVYCAQAGTAQVANVATYATTANNASNLIGVVTASIVTNGGSYSSLTITNHNATTNYMISTAVTNQLVVGARDSIVDADGPDTFQVVVSNREVLCVNSSGRTEVYTNMTIAGDLNMSGKSITNYLGSCVRPWAPAESTANFTLNLTNGPKQVLVVTNAITYNMPAADPTNWYQVSVSTYLGTNSWTWGTNNIYFTTNATIGVNPIALPTNRFFNLMFYKLPQETNWHAAGM